MVTFVEQLWNGNIAPYKTSGSSDPDVRELDELLDKNKASLEKRLTDGQKILFDKYISCRDDHSYLITVHAFRDGFSLACRLVMEAMYKD